ncbi:hypothetical protein, partial [Enterococcus faecalis]
IIGNPSLNHRYRKGFYSLFKTLQQNLYYLTGGNNSMSRFCKFGKLHVTKGNGDKLLDILLTASKKLKRSLAPTGNLYR